MQTIFIPIFDGVESKNILRTPILTTLLKDPGVRVVLFLKNEERARYHIKEFSDPRILYEVVEIRPTGSLDSLFRRLKFLLIDTESTRIWQKFRYKREGMRLQYYAGRAAHWILARSFIRGAIRVADWWLVRSTHYSDYFDRYQPDAVFLANLFEEPEVYMLREAKERGILCIGFINSWDKATGRGMIRLLPDKIIVYNDFIKGALIQHHQVPAQSIFVSGIPQYDQYFERDVSSRNDFFRSRGLKDDTRLIVYSPIGKALSDSDWEIIDLLKSLEEEGRFGGDVEILVRFPPNDFVEEEELAKRPTLLYDYPGIRFSRVRGVDWDMGFEELRHLRDTLVHMSLLICYASSISVDAAILDHPVINLDFEVGKDAEGSGKAPTRFYGTTHYRHALMSGGIRLVKSVDELVEWTRIYLEDPKRDQEGRRRLTLEQCKFLDGRSGERIGKFVLGLIGNKK